MLDCLASHGLLQAPGFLPLDAKVAVHARSARSAQACRPSTVRAGAGCSVRTSRTKSSSGDAAGLVHVKTSLSLLVSITCSGVCHALLSLNRCGPVQGQLRQLAVRCKHFLYGLPCADVVWSDCMRPVSVQAHGSAPSGLLGWRGAAVEPLADHCESYHHWQAVHQPHRHAARARKQGRPGVQDGLQGHPAGRQAHGAPSVPATWRGARLLCAHHAWPPFSVAILPLEVLGPPTR